MSEEEARLFAIEAHGDQKYGKLPYHTHLSAVWNNVGCVRDPVLKLDFLRTVAWLHDILEDTPVTFEDLRSEFGYWVASPVAIITDSADAKNRKERKRLANATFKMLDPEQITHRAALIVKAADRLSNITHSKLSEDKGKLDMYRAEHEAFEAAVRRPDVCPLFWNQMKFELGLIEPNNT
jgi:(p)ppGpp synthase/HD superfamily hydrolase